MAMKNLVLRPDGDFVLKNVRLSYVFAFEPSKNVDDNGNVTKKFKATAILPKDTHAEEIKYLQGVLAERQKEKFKKRLPSDRLALRDGDPTNKDEYANAYILVASEREDHPPAVLDRDGKTRLTARDDKMYSGCIGNMLFRFWDQDNTTNRGGQRINANLLGLQFMDHGPKFSSVHRPNEDEMFDDEGGDDGFGDDDIPL